MTLQTGGLPMYSKMARAGFHSLAKLLAPIWLRNWVFIPQSATDEISLPSSSLLFDCWIEISHSGVPQIKYHWKALLWEGLHPKGGRGQFLKTKILVQINFDTTQCYELHIPIQLKPNFYCLKNSLFTCPIFYYWLNRQGTKIRTWGFSLKHEKGPLESSKRPKAFRPHKVNATPPYMRQSTN
jgi:hypothetical protein